MNIMLIWYVRSSVNIVKEVTLHCVQLVPSSTIYITNVLNKTVFFTECNTLVGEYDITASMAFLQEVKLMYLQHAAS